MGKRRTLSANFTVEATSSAKQSVNFDQFLSVTQTQNKISLNVSFLKCITRFEILQDGLKKIQRSSDESFQQSENEGVIQRSGITGIRSCQVAALYVHRILISTKLQ